ADPGPADHRGRQRRGRAGGGPDPARSRDVRDPGHHRECGRRDRLLLRVGAGPPGFLLGGRGDQHQAAPRDHASLLRDPSYVGEQAHRRAPCRIRAGRAAGGQRNDGPGYLSIIWGVSPALVRSFPRRVLITGVSNPLGAEVARRLSTQVPALFGCDVADPVSAVEAMDFVHADTRHAVIGKLVRQLHIDTVVHMAVKVDSHGDDRTVHETNVIGTMNVLTGCAGPSSPVRRLVVKSSQAVYGASPAYPSFVTEEVAGSDRHAYGLKRDLLDMEQLAQEFSLRTPGCRVCILRLGYRVSEGTALGQYLSLPIVPTFAGFDPRLQLLHEDDAAEAVVRSALNDHEGVFNVAGDGIVLLSQAIGIMGGRPVPLLPFYGR